ncbi:hypothetical protein RUM43_005461 [Polyplax serrata]|uniref:Uncharacterized protein n=1 Tax=Polyplax serrata TaxID=468196 RepID=A0AAN8PJ87_POLSC
MVHEFVGGFSDLELFMSFNTQNNRGDDAFVRWKSSGGTQRCNLLNTLEREQSVPMQIPSCEIMGAQGTVVDECHAEDSKIRESSRERGESKSESETECPE